MKPRKRGGIVIGIILATLVCLTIAAQPGHGKPKPPRPAGDPPVAVDDTATTPENTAVTIKVLLNDTDADNDINVSTVDFDPGPAVQVSATTPKGTFVVDTDGVVTFTPAANANGPATIKYTVTDSAGNVSNPADINVDIQSTNVAPVAVNDAASTTNDKDVDINVLANDSDSDGTLDTSKVDLNTTLGGVQKSVDAPEGKWSANKGVVNFKPKDTFVGSADINYVVYDNDNTASNIATITVTVTSSNKAPVAANDTGGTTLNKPVTVNVVANDTDSDGTIDPSKVDLNVNTAGVQATANTAQGTWSVNAQGLVAYTPVALFLGTATLKYTVMDNDGTESNQATITITVQAINIAPVAVNDNVTTAKNKAVTINVLQNDSDIDGTIDATKVDLNPTLAGIQNTAESDQGDYSVDNHGVVTFTPANNFTGFAATTYNITDNAGAVSNTASINITVQNVNSPPVATDDTGATSENVAVNVDVVTNDTDSDGVINAAMVDLNTSKAGVQNTASTPQGDFSVNNLGIVSYTPKKNFTGSAIIGYTVSDNQNAISNIAKITIAVQPANAPLALEDRDTTLVNKAIDVDVVANDHDTDGQIDPATVDLNITTDGLQRSNTTDEGTWEVVNTGIVTFTPKKDYKGDASIQYTVKDNKGVLSNPALITVVVVESPNEAPEIVAFEDTSDTLRYVPGNPTLITDEFRAEDADDDSLAVAEIGFVTEFYSLGKDKLIFQDTKRIKGKFDQETGLLTLSGVARIRDYNDAVQSVKYEFTGSNEMHSTIKTLYVRVSDGKSFSKVKERIIRINSSLNDLDIPTAFTPNSDGANDTWRILTPGDISGSDFADAEVKVYDKKGAIVFDANGLEHTWDGTFQGKQLPVDTYYYTIVLKQQQRRYKGIVAILR